MKTKSLILIAVLIIAFAAMAAPVMAADASDVTVVSGNPTASVALTVSSATAAITLTPGTTVPYTALELTATSNGPATIKVYDTMTGSKATAGYMENRTAADVWQGDKLTAPLKIKGAASIGKFTGQTTAFSIVGTPGTTLYTEAGPDTQTLTTSLEQAVAAPPADPLLPGTNTYQIPLTFTITSG